MATHEAAANVAIAVAFAPGTGSETHHAFATVPLRIHNWKEVAPSLYQEPMATMNLKAFASPALALAVPTAEPHRTLGASASPALTLGVVPAPMVNIRAYAAPALALGVTAATQHDMKARATVNVALGVVPAPCLRFYAHAAPALALGVTAATQHDMKARATVNMGLDAGKSRLGKVHPASAAVRMLLLSSASKHPPPDIQLSGAPAFNDFVLAVEVEAPNYKAVLTNNEYRLIIETWEGYKCILSVDD